MNENLIRFPELDWLLDPISVDFFRSNYLEARPLHLFGRAPDRYADLFSLADPEQILWGHEAEMARSLTLLRNGERISAPPLSPGRLRAWVDAHYTDGATVLLPAIGRFVPSVARLQRAVERFVGGHVIVNAYLTPSNAQGFEPHFDPHDIFVLQIAGAKIWRLFDSVVVLPTPAQARVVAPSELTEPVATPLLRPGDLLYLPRGMIHEARTQGETSLHLSIGFELPTWADVIVQCVRAATDSSLTLRRSVAAAPELVAEIAPMIQAIRTLGGEASSVGQALECIRGSFFAGLEPLPRPEFVDWNRLSVRSPDDHVERVPGMVAEVSASDTAVRMTFPGLGYAYDDGKVPIVLTEPIFLEPTLRFIATSEKPFRVRDLPVEVSDQAKLSFVQRLVTSGLLQLADPVS